MWILPGPFIKAIESAEYAQMKEDLDGIPIDETKKKWLMEALGTFKATGATFDALTGTFWEYFFTSKHVVKSFNSSRNTYS